MDNNLSITYDSLRNMGWSVAETWQYLIEQSFDSESEREGE